MKSKLDVREIGPVRWGLFLFAVTLAVSLAHPPVATAKRVKIPVQPRAATETPQYSLEPFPYRIAPGDELHVDFGLVLDREAVEAIALVRPDGAVTLPQIGDVMMAGLSTQEADSILAERYADVYVNPSITLSVRTVAGNLVHVLGEVKNPGSYPLQPNMTALQAVAQAGGFDDDAKQGEVVVLRRNGPNQLTYKRLNLKEVFGKGRAGSDAMLRRYDIVFVNRTTIGNFRNWVQQAIIPTTQIADLYLRGWTLFNLDQVYPNLGFDQIDGSR